MNITFTDNLTAEEKNERALKKEEEAKTKREQEDLKEKEEQDRRNAMQSEEEKINWDMRKVVKKRHADAAERLRIKKLSKKEEKDLFKSIRYNFLSHAELLQLSEKPLWQRVAKDYIVDGLSYRLN